MISDSLKHKLGVFGSYRLVVFEVVAECPGRRGRLFRVSARRYGGLILHLGSTNFSQNSRFSSERFTRDLSLVRIGGVVENFEYVVCCRVQGRWRSVEPHASSLRARAAGNDGQGLLASAYSLI